MADLNNNENNMPEGIDSINELLESVGIAPLSEEEENEKAKGAEKDFEPV